MTEERTESALQWEVERFLFREADLLDRGRYDQWLEVLASDIDYRIPVRLTRESHSGDQEFSTSSFHMVEDLGSLRARVARFETEYAWSENPRSRVRRFITNVRVEPGPDPNTYDVRSNLLFFWARENVPSVLMSAERHDILWRDETGWKLARRTVFLDHTTLPIPNLAVFL